MAASGLAAGGTSVGGLATGEGGDRIVIDDPLNAKQARSEAERAAGLRAYAALNEDIEASGEMIVSESLADPSLAIGTTGSQLPVGTGEAPTAGRAESTYRYTVIDTIGGGTSEVQKNIIATRKPGLPKNF